MANSNMGMDPNPVGGGGDVGDRVRLKGIMKRFEKAKSRWDSWLPVWEEIYDFVLPHRENFIREQFGTVRTDRIYDETAVAGLPRFASRLQLGFFPPNGRAFALKPGPYHPDITSSQEYKAAERQLDEVTELIHEGLRASNFNSEFHEGLQDLALGTMNMLVEPGRFAGDLHFTAVPPSQLAILPGAQDTVSDWFRWNDNTDLTEIMHKYPDAKFSDKMLNEQKRNPDRRTRIIEAVIFDSDNKFKDEFTYYLISDTDKYIMKSHKMMTKGEVPWITTRWSKSGYEVWGRGPVLQAMPAIKVLNLTVELILENAEMAISGAYVYDDDGVFNPDNVRLEPGKFVPRTPGAQIEALTSPARFEIGQFILEDMRRNVRKALFIDELDNRANAKTPLSATEVSERLADVARDMGAVAGRMQKEFLQPLVERIVKIYTDQGVIEKLPKIDGREIKVVAVSPLLRAQDQQDVSDFMRFQQAAAATFGPEFTPALLNQREVVAFLAQKFGLNEALLASEQEVQTNLQQAAQLAGQASGAPQE